MPKAKKRGASARKAKSESESDFEEDDDLEELKREAKGFMRKKAKA